MPQRGRRRRPELDGHRRPGDREVAVPSGDLFDDEAAASRPDRHPDAGEQLALVEGGLPDP